MMELSGVNMISSTNLEMSSDAQVRLSRTNPGSTGNAGKVRRVTLRLLPGWRTAASDCCRENQRSQGCSAPTRFRPVHPKSFGSSCTSTALPTPLRAARRGLGGCALPSGNSCGRQRRKARRRHQPRNVSNLPVPNRRRDGERAEKSDSVWSLHIRNTMIDSESQDGVVRPRGL
jgi:hypothetical protein